MTPASQAARPSLPGAAAIAAHMIPLLGKVPFRIQALVVGQALNRLFGTAARDGELDFLHGRCMVIEVSDANIRWPLTLERKRIVVGAKTQTADACVRGDTATFLALANRHADPDTLFFQRRLSMQGDTELGLYLKNWLDTLDPQTLPAALRFLLRSAEKVFGGPAD